MKINEYNLSVRKYSDALYTFGMSHSIGREEAEDIVQECFAVLWNKRREVEIGKAKSFLFTIAYHKIMDVFRKRKRNRKVKIEVIPTEENWEFDKKKWIMQELNNIPAQQRSAILLKDWEGYSYNEIAEIMNISLEQVKVNIHRGRKALRQKLQFLKS